MMTGDEMERLQGAGQRGMEVVFFVIIVIVMIVIVLIIVAIVETRVFKSRSSSWCQHLKRAVQASTRIC